MSPVLTVPAARAARRGWTDVVPLLDMTLYRDRFGASPASQAIRLSDRSIAYPTGAPTMQYLGYVEDWGELGDALNPLDPQVSIGSFSVRVRNDRPVPGATRLSALFRYGTNGTGYDPALSTAVLRLWFRSTDPTVDQVKLWRLTLQEPSDITPETLVLHFGSVELEIEDRTMLLRVTTDRFPLAAPSAVGQRIPLLLGTVRQVPALFVKAGLIDRLRAAITTTGPGVGEWLPCSTPDVIARWTPGPVQIDGEQILIDAIDAPNAQLRVGQRGYNGTVPALHSLGAEVTQGLNEYVAIFGQNMPDYGIASLDALYTDQVFKDPTAKPTHVINMADTLSDLAPDWAALGYTFVTARFTAIFDPGGAGAVVYNEGAEIAMRAGCWASAPGFQPGGGFGIAGHPVYRCGIDAPCGTAWDYYRDAFRWNISALAGSQSSVKLRFSCVNGQTGAYGLSGDAPQGALEETFASTPHNTGYRNLRVDVVAWDAPLAPGVEAATVLEQHTPIHNGQQQDVVGYVCEVDLTTAFNSAKSAGKTNLVLLIRVADESQPTQVSHGVTKHPWVNNWWPLLADTVWTPTLYLGGVSVADGALARRPAGGQSASAAEAALGVVTADLHGLSGVLPWKAVVPDTAAGYYFSGNLNFLQTVKTFSVDPTSDYLLVIINELASTSYPEGDNFYVSQVAYDGVLMTLLGRVKVRPTPVGSGHPSARIYAYGLARPHTAAAHNLVVDRITLGGDGGFNGFIQALTFHNVGSVNPTVLTQSGGLAFGQVLAVSQAFTATGGMVCGFLFAELGCNNNVTPNTCPLIQPGAGQTDFYRAQGPTSVDGVTMQSESQVMMGSWKSGVGALTLSETDTVPNPGTIINPIPWVYLVLELLAP